MDFENNLSGHLIQFLVSLQSTSAHLPIFTTFSFPCGRRDSTSFIRRDLMICSRVQSFENVPSEVHFRSLLLDFQISVSSTTFRSVYLFYTPQEQRNISEEFIRFHRQLKVASEFAYFVFLTYFHFILYHYSSTSGNLIYFTNSKCYETNTLGSCKANLVFSTQSLLALICISVASGGVLYHTLFYTIQR